MIRVQQSDFDLTEEMNRLCDGNPAIGGVCSFIGRVRDFQNDKTDSDKVQAMTLEHYPGMTEKKLLEIEAIAHERWSLEDTLIIHRYGRLEPGDNIVLVMAASPHRQAAFEACAFLMDFLKTEAPFWKLEENQDGAGRWVDARDADEHAKKKWQT